jgi:DNA-binding NtrC family response regulator
MMHDPDVIEETQVPPSSIEAIMTAIDSIDFGKGIVPHSAVNALERRLIIEALRAANGNQSKACELLGIPRDMLRYRQKKLGIDAYRFRRHVQPLQNVASMPADADVFE